METLTQDPERDQPRDQPRGADDDNSDLHSLFGDDGGADDATSDLDLDSLFGDDSGCDTSSLFTEDTCTTHVESPPSSRSSPASEPEKTASQVSGIILPATAPKVGEQVTGPFAPSSAPKKSGSFLDTILDTYQFLPQTSHHENAISSPSLPREESHMSQTRSVSKEASQSLSPSTSTNSPSADLGLEDDLDDEFDRAFDELSNIDSSTTADPNQGAQDGHEDLGPMQGYLSQSASAQQTSAQASSGDGNPKKKPRKSASRTSTRAKKAPKAPRATKKKPPKTSSQVPGNNASTSDPGATNGQPPEPLIPPPPPGWRDTHAPAPGGIDGEPPDLSHMAWKPQPPARRKSKKEKSAAPGTWVDLPKRLDLRLPDDINELLPFIRLEFTTNSELFKTLGLDELRGKDLMGEARKYLRLPGNSIREVRNEDRSTESMKHSRFKLLETALILLIDEGWGDKWFRTPTLISGTKQSCWPGDSSDIIMDFIPLLYKLARNEDARRRNAKIKAAETKLQDEAVVPSTYHPAPASMAAGPTHSTPQVSNHTMEATNTLKRKRDDAQPQAAALPTFQPSPGFAMAPPTPSSPQVFGQNGQLANPINASNTLNHHHDAAAEQAAVRLPADADLIYVIKIMDGPRQVHPTVQESSTGDMICSYADVVSIASSRNVCGTIEVLGPNGLHLISDEYAWRTALRMIHYDEFMDNTVKVRIRVQEAIVID